MSNKVEIIISAKDMAGRTFRTIDRDIGTFSKKATGHFDRVKKSVLSLQRAFIGLAGAYAVKSSFSSLINSASDLQEVTSKFDTVFQGNLKNARQWSRELVSSYAMSTREAKQYLASIQDLLVPMGVQADLAGKLSSRITKLAADLGSFNNLPTAQVIDDIQSALVGNYETMKKYGVVLNASVVQEKALAMGLAKTKDELTAAHKAQAAYALIVAGSQAAIGDMARTSGSYANQLKQAKAGVEDLTAALGSQLIPMATSAIRIFNDLAGNVKLVFGLGEVESLMKEQHEIITQMEMIEKDRKREFTNWIHSLYGEEDVYQKNAQKRLDFLKIRLELIRGELDDLLKPKGGGGGGGGSSAFPAGTSGPSDIFKELVVEERKALATALEEEERFIQLGLEKQKEWYEEMNALAMDAYQLEGALAAEAFEQSLKDAEDFVDGYNKLFSEDMKTAVTGWASNFSATLTDLVWEADVSFGDIAKSFGKMLTQMAMQKMIVEPILGAVFPTKNAKGNIFSGSGIRAYENSIVNRPTFFQFAHGIGLMGEGSHPEAIMPLTRTRGGDLGVKAIGASVEVNIYNNNGSQVSQSTGRTANGSLRLDIMIDEMMADKARNASKFQDVLKSTYNLSPVLGGR